MGCVVSVYNSYLFEIDEPNRGRSLRHTLELGEVKNYSRTEFTFLHNH